jgi:hypothetical protein
VGLHPLAQQSCYAIRYDNNNKKSAKSQYPG